MPTMLDPHVPLVGQQVTVDGYAITIAARCHCTSAGSPVLMSVTCSPVGTSVSPGQCPSCGLGYSVQGMELDRQARLTFAVAVLSTTPPKDS